MVMHKTVSALAMVSLVISAVVVPVGAQTTIQPLDNSATAPGRMPSAVQPFGSGTIITTPGQMPSTVQPFGSGAIITTPGQMPSTVQPFGKGAIITTPGQRPVICTPIGTTLVCN